LNTGFSPASLNRNSRLSTSFRFQVYSTRLLGMLLLGFKIVSRRHQSQI
jgi:hypothetical protein